MIQKFFQFFCAQACRYNLSVQSGETSAQTAAPADGRAVAIRNIQGERT